MTVDTPPNSPIVAPEKPLTKAYTPSAGLMTNAAANSPPPISAAPVSAIPEPLPEQSQTLPLQNLIEKIPQFSETGYQDSLPDAQPDSFSTSADAASASQAEGNDAVSAPGIDTYSSSSEFSTSLFLYLVSSINFC